MSQQGQKMDCQSLTSRIDMMLREGTRRARKKRWEEEVSALIEELAERCDPLKGRYFRIWFDRTCGNVSGTNAARQFKTLRGDLPRTSKLTMQCLVFEAQVTLGTGSWDENRRLRSEALELAVSLDMAIEAVVILTNWVFAEFHYGKAEEVKTLERQAYERFDALAPAEGYQPAAIEARRRLGSHTAKRLLREAVNATSPEQACDLLKEATDSYTQAIADAEDSEHHRVNLLIEWAENLWYYTRSTVNKQAAQNAEEQLDLAYRALDAHSCDMCEAYFYLVRARMKLDHAADSAAWDRDAARKYLKQTRKDLAGAERLIRKLPIPLTDAIAETRQRFDDEWQQMERPRKIFLSQATADKPVVKRYRDALEALNYRTWMDDPDLRAGDGRDRAILKALQECCATVFFITKNFEDQRYLAREIEFAMQEQIKRPYFKTIVLVLRQPDEDAPSVPDLLQTAIWKEVHHELEGLTELVRALPLDLPHPQWQPEPSA